MFPFHSTEAIELARRSSLAIAAGLAAGTAWIARGGAAYDLEGKNALVTGGARGLGLEIARVLAEKGAQVAVVARDVAEIDRAVADLRRRAPHALVTGVPCDLREGSTIE